jgi:hypothetical protein
MEVETMKIIKKYIILFVVGLISVTNCANVTKKSGTAAFDFLKISQGARAAAMGDSFVGLSNDVNATYWNPAGIAQIESSEFVANYTVWFESISRGYLGYVCPKSKFGALGFSVNYLFTNIESRVEEDDDNYDLKTVGNVVATIAYSKKVSEKVMVGSGLKYINEDLYLESISGLAVDFGGLYKINNKLSAGLSIQNIGIQLTNSNREKLPVLLRAGIAKTNNKLTLLSDFYLSLIDTTSSLSMGSEYRLNNFFYPRIGYKYRISNTNASVLSGVSGGFGLSYLKYKFDYAIVSYGSVGLTHRLDFIVKF